VGKPVKHIFLTEIVGGSLAPQTGEILDVKWLSYDEVMVLQNTKKLRAPWIWDIIQKVEQST
jgi:NADH pyrophosphatase NudC (nudix superfamily)